MYGGKKIRAGDSIYVFASENEGGAGLIARAVVVSATRTPKRVDVERQTPRVGMSTIAVALFESHFQRRTSLHSSVADSQPLQTERCTDHDHDLSGVRVGRIARGITPVQYQVLTGAASESTCRHLSP